jgi:hypothetical protein
MIVTRRAATLACAAAAISVTAILVLWVFPGYLSVSSKCPVSTTEGGRVYCAESVTVVPYQCSPGTACAYCPPGVAFHGILFNLSVRGSSGLATLWGCVTEGNSTFPAVHLLGDYLGPPSENWTSPDHTVLVEWQTPYATIGSDGQLTANVTCGVSIATTIVL